MTPESAIALVFGFATLGGVVVIVSGMRHRARILEMAHRERLAMIERGVTPPAGLIDSYQERPPARSHRMLSGGIVVVGLGLALGVLLAFASREPEIAVGVGGAIAVVGLAFIVTALVAHPNRFEPDRGVPFRGPDRPAPPPAPL